MQKIDVGSIFFAEKPAFWIVSGNNYAARLVF
jgi:hypothetical protein